ncbi:MAG: GAF domain-containing protein [Candidatus Manganitrophus sp. SB1]|nr:GAF domain-containing protein [Candidatus Manganitrophus morganii]
MYEEQVPVPMEEDSGSSFSNSADYEPPPSENRASSSPFEKLEPILQVMADHAELVRDPPQFLNLLLDQIFKVLGSDILLLFSREEKAKEWVLLSHRGMPKDFGKNGFIPRAWQSLPTIILQQGPALFSHEISKDPVFIGQIIRGMNIQSFGGATLQSEGKVLGSLSVGYAKPDAMTPKDRDLFLMIAKLISPFVTQQQGVPSAAAPETPRLTAGLDLSGRIVSINSEFAQFLGYEKEQVHRTPFSQHLTATGLSTFSGQVEALKSGQRNLPPFHLEVLRRGESRRILNVQLSPYLKETKMAGVTISAQDATEIDVLEKDLSDKKIELNLLESLFASLSRSFQEGDVFRTALEKILSLMNIEGGYLLRFDDKKQRFLLVAQKGLSPEKAQRLEKQGAKVGENVIGKIVEKKSPTLVVAEDVKGPLKKRFVGEDGLLAYMGVPIQASGQIWGTLSLFSRSRLFTESDLGVLGFVGREIGFTIDNMKLFDQARQRVEDLTIMNEVSQSITKSLHLDQLLSSVANSLTRMIGASNCYIFSVDDKRNLLYGVAASDQRGDAIRKVEIKMNENTLLSLTAREQHSFVIENAPQDPRISKKWIDLFKSRSLLSVPLIIKERVIGVLLLDETRYFRQFTPEEIQKIVTMANQVSVAIENATLYQAVTKHMERLQTLSSAIVNIQEEERRRIAQELHDEAGQALTGIKMNLEWVEKELPPSEKAVREKIEEVKSQVGKIMEELRRLSYDLRPAILDELGLVPTLRWYIEEYSKRTRTAVHLQTTGLQKRLSAKIEILLYRVIQEALTNVAKHAQAESVILSLEKKDVHIHLYITDDGKGFEVKRYFSSPPMIRRGLGILGMKERVELAGGTFFIDSDLGQGTRISIKVPIVKRGS